MSDYHIQLAVVLGVYFFAMAIVLFLVHIFTRKYNDK